GRILAGRVGKGGTAGGGRQPGNIDVVLERNRDAEQRTLAFVLERARIRAHLVLRAQRDEDGRIVVRANACVAFRDCLFRAARARAVGGDERGDRRQSTLLSRHGSGLRERGGLVQWFWR